MKMIFTLIVLSMASLGFAKSHGPAGCGLGSMVLEGQTGLVMNVLAATLNGTSGGQTFGMSTGTSNCDVDEKTKVTSVNYIEANKIALANDIARGEGETLLSLSKIYNCGNIHNMGSTLQANYETIFATGQSAEQINAKIADVLVSERACI